MDPRGWQRLVVLAIAAVPMAVMLWFANLSDFGTPITDQWVFLTFFDQALSGKAGIAELFATHNQVHVTASLRLAMLALAVSSGWSMRVEVLAGALLLLSSTLLLIRLGSREGRMGVANVVLTSLLMWSPVAYWAFAWPIGFVHFFTNACVIAAIFALRASAASPVPAWRFACATALCAIASFARMEGLFAWWALLPLVVGWRPPREWPRIRLAIWGAVGVLCWSGWWVATRVGANVSGGSALDGLSLAAELPIRLLGLLGLPTGYFIQAFEPSAALGSMAWPVGLVVGSAFAWSVYRIGRSRDAELGQAALPWITLGLYVLAFAGAVAIARLSYVLPEIFAGVYLSMYSTTLVLFSIATMQLMFLVAKASQPILPLRLAWAYTLTLLVGSLLSASVMAPGAAILRETTLGTDACIELLHYLDRRNNCTLSGLNPSEAQIEMLERTGLRTLRRDLVFDEGPGLAIAAFERAEPVEENVVRWRGWATAPADTQPDAIALARADRPERLVALLAMEPGDDRIPWSLLRRFPKGHPARTDLSGFVVWLYDRETGRLIRADVE